MHLCAHTNALRSMISGIWVPLGYWFLARTLLRIKSHIPVNQELLFAVWVVRTLSRDRDNSGLVSRLCIIRHRNLTTYCSERVVFRRLCHQTCPFRHLRYQWGLTHVSGLLASAVTIAFVHSILAQTSSSYSNNSNRLTLWTTLRSIHVPRKQIHR